MKHLNYTYGAKAPHVNADRVADQISLAHRYRNALVEIERARREQIYAARQRLMPGLDAAQAKIESAETAIAAHLSTVAGRNAKARSRTGTPADRAKTAELRAAKKQATDEAKAIKQTEKGPELVAAMEAIKKWTSDQVQKARAQCGVYWGTYLAVEADADASFSKSVLLPKFRRWTGDGAVSVHMQPPVSAEDVLAGKDTTLRVEISPDNPKFAVVYLRIGSGEERRVPVWAVARFKMHRPLPEGAMVKWAYLQRTRTGLAFHWEVRFTLGVPETSTAPKPRGTEGACGVDVGWRMVKDGLRVAVWAGSDGKTGELVIPHDRIDRLRQCDALQSRRDLNFDEARNALIAWMDGRKIPDWLTEATKFIGQWKSAGRLAFVAIRWRENRFDGDAAMLDVLEAWRKQDKHLVNWEMHARSMEWRKELYRLFARDLLARYKTVAIERINWTDLTSKADADEEKDDQTRWYMRLASVGLLSSILKDAGAIKAEAANTTRECHLCEHVNVFDAARNLSHTCDGCGAVWDQDHNAARNLLKVAASGELVAETPESREVTAQPGVRQRWTRAMKRAKANENRAARKAARNAMVGVV